MITNNKYIRGNIGEFDNQVSSNININDYNGNKANKYLVTKEYLLKYNNNYINDKKVVIEQVINDTVSKEDIIIMFQPGAEQLIKFKDLSFILQHVDTITEEGIEYKTFKNYLIALNISYDNSNDEYIIDINLNDKHEIIEGNIYYILSYNDGMIHRDRASLLSSICLNNKSVYPFVILEQTIFYNELSSNSPVDLNYTIKLNSYLGKYYDDKYNEDISDENRYFYNIFNFEFKINSLIISKNINLSNIYSYAISNGRILNNFVYYSSTRFKEYFDLTKIKSSDYPSYTNQDKINIYITNTTKFNLNLVSYTGNSLKDTKYIFSRSLNTYNTYPLFNIFNYDYVLININNTYNLYQKKNTSPFYYNDCVFPKYTDDDGTTISVFNSNVISKLFLYDNSNNNFYYCETYDSSGMNLTLSTISSNILNILKDNFNPDVSLNTICNLYCNKYSDSRIISSISFSFTNYINKKYLIYDFILPIEDSDKSIIGDSSYYKISFDGFIRFIDNITS